MDVESTKRTPSESNLDEKPVGFADLSSPQEEDNVKRARLDSQSGTTLQDLPIELLEVILIRAVVMEVKGLKLSRWAWKEKYHADLIMDRLGTVSSQWNSILTSDYFRNQVYGFLGGIEQGTSCLKPLYDSLLAVSPVDLVLMKDEMFVLWSTADRRFFINVYEHEMCSRKQKDVIPLTDINPLSLVVSSVSNCLYLLNREQSLWGSVMRIWRSDSAQFKLSAVISDLWLPNPTLSAATNGDFILSQEELGISFPVVRIYDATGYLKHAVRLSTEISSLSQIISKSNGNLVLVSGMYQTKLTEINLKGNILRRYEMAPEDGYSGALIVSQADTYGRLLTVTVERGPRKVILLDPEFNQLRFDVKLDDIYSLGATPFKLHFYSDRNVIVKFYDIQDMKMSIFYDWLKFFRVINE